MSYVRTPIVVPKALRQKHFGYILANGVKCILVHDASAKVPAAAMSIHSGSLNDPVELPGLAHFCEHMLFMGTDKFPVEGEYQSYISKNGGYTNAWTSDTATTFYFRVGDDAFDGALTRFVEFFVAPCFNASAVAREVQAVHSEDEKNHSVDYWRLAEVMQTLFCPEHPRSRYGNGNLVTLRDEPAAQQVDLRDGLLRYYQKFYVAEAACIAVYSARQPETVMTLIDEALSRMHAGAPAPFSYLSATQPLFKAGVQPGWVNVRTVNKYQHLMMLWPVRSAAALWRSVPAAYVAHVLGHECDTSVLALLKRRGLATAMSVGPRRVDDDFDTLLVSIALTEQGRAALDEVVQLIYHGLGLARGDGVDEAVYNEMKAEERLHFESFEIDSPENHCASLATNANDTDLEHCLVGRNLILQDDWTATLDYMDQLTPERGVVFLQWSDLPVTGDDDVAEHQRQHSSTDGSDEANPDAVRRQTSEARMADQLFAQLPDFARVPVSSTTRFHGAKYAQVDIPDDHLRRWGAALRGPHPAELALPKPNPFLATDLTVFASTATTPVEETFTAPHGVTVMRKDAGYYNTFNCSVRWNVLSPVIYESALSWFYASVMANVLRDALTEVSYYGALAALSSQVSAGAGGIGVYVVGPYEHLHTFFFTLLAAAVDAATLTGSEATYTMYAQDVVRGLKSRDSAQPYELVLDRFAKLARCVSYTHEEVLEAAAAASYDAYQTFVASYLANGFIYECFVAGNIPSAQAMRVTLVDGIERVLNEHDVAVAARDRLPRFRDAYALAKPVTSTPSSLPSLLTSIDVLSFPPFNPDNVNVCVMLNLYAGTETPQTRALCDCAMKLMSASFFNALRTRETLGYVVLASPTRVEGAAHLTFLAQSAVSGVDGLYLLSRILAYLVAVNDNIDVLCTQAEVRRVAEGLIRQREKRPDSVDADATRLEGDYSHPNGMAHRQLEIDALRALTADDMKTFLRDVVVPTHRYARGLAMIVNSASTAKAADDALRVSGRRTLQLPRQRASEHTTDAAPIAASDGGDEDEEATPMRRTEDLVLPTFAEPTQIEVEVWDGVAEYQYGLPTIASRTF